MAARREGSCPMEEGEQARATLAQSGDVGGRSLARATPGKERQPGAAGEGGSREAGAAGAAAPGTGGYERFLVSAGVRDDVRT